LAFIEDNGDISVKSKAPAVLSFENGTELGTLDYFDMHGAKVETGVLRINCSITDFLCNRYDPYTGEKYVCLIANGQAKTQVRYT
jgi:hypothetical protein